MSDVSASRSTTPIDELKKKVRELSLENSFLHRRMVNTSGFSKELRKHLNESNLREEEEKRHDQQVANLRAILDLLPDFLKRIKVMASLPIVFNNTRPYSKLLEYLRVNRSEFNDMARFKGHILSLIAYESKTNSNMLSFSFHSDSNENSYLVETFCDIFPVIDKMFAFLLWTVVYFSLNNKDPSKEHIVSSTIMEAYQLVDGYGTSIKEAHTLKAISTLISDWKKDYVKLINFLQEFYNNNGGK